MKKHLALAAIIALSTSSAFAQQSANDTVKYSTDVPQTISVNSPTDPAAAAAGQVMNVKWTVTTNNAFKYTFSGSAKDDDGSDLTVPRLHKQDVDASGNLVASSYDHLDTTAGVLIENYQSVQTADSWGKAASASGTIDNLVAAETVATSPVGTTGRIMPGDDTSTADISLFLKGTGDQFDQSGLYNAEVMITVTADEQEV